MDEETNNWIKAHIQMFEFFGVVTPMLVSDNCTTVHMARPNGRFCGAKRPKCEAEQPLGFD